MRRQPQRADLWWVGLLGMIGYALVATALIYLAVVVLLSLAQYMPTLP